MICFSSALATRESKPERRSKRFLDTTRYVMESMTIPRRARSAGVGSIGEANYKMMHVIFSFFFPLDAISHHHA
jgi:hypothetical protein